MTVPELLARHSSRDLAEWMAYDRLRPFGQGRLVQMLADLLAMTANINRDRKKHPDPFTPGAFVPWHLPHEAPEPPDPQAAARRGLAEKIKGFLLPRTKKG